MRYRRPILISVLTGVFLWLGMTGCESVTVGEGDKKTDSLGQSTLRLINAKKQDPGPLTFFYYPPGTPNIENAANGKKLATVNQNTMVSVKIPEGFWKLAYANEAGVLYPMEDDDDLEPAWLKGQFVKDSTYLLQIDTDGNRTMWIHTFNVFP